MAAFISRRGCGLVAGVALLACNACGDASSTQSEDSGVPAVDAPASDAAQTGQDTGAARPDASGVDATTGDATTGDATSGDAATPDAAGSDSGEDASAPGDADRADATPGDADSADAGQSDAHATDAAGSDASSDANRGDAWAGDAGVADAPGTMDAPATMDASGCASACPAGSGCLDGRCQPVSASNWRMFQYDEAHAGYSPTEPGVPPLSDAWTWPVPDAGSLLSLHPVAAENGTVFVTYDLDLATAGPLVALNVHDGTVVFSHDFGSTTGTGHPCVVDGTVYVQTSKGLNAGDSAQLWALDATNGNVRWSVPFDSQGERYWAPTVANGVVYIDGGRFGGMYAFHVADGSQVFFDGNLGQYDQWTPTYFGGVLYTWIAGGLVAHDPTTDAFLWSNGLPWADQCPYCVQSAAAFDSTGGYVISPPYLAAVDPVSQDFRWTANQSYAATPAVAHGVVYAPSGGALAANDATTGARLWSFPGDGKLSYPPVVANGVVYVSSTDHTYAVDVQTHGQAWTAPRGGWLAVTQGRLVVAGLDRQVHAYALTLR
jgi:outer membrane protein assembly factor BamB